MDRLKPDEIKAGLDRFREGGRYELEVVAGTDRIHVIRTNSLTGEKSDLDPGDAPLLPPSR